MRVPEARIRAVNQAAVDPSGEHVLYWMGAARRPAWSFALDRAIELARELRKPLRVFEPLRTDYPHASDRLHAFMLAGMRDNAEAFERAGVGHLGYVEPEGGARAGLLEALAERACAVVADDYPGPFLEKLLADAGAGLKVRLEAVDSNGLYPMHATPRVFTTAASFRRHLQKELRPHLLELPRANPLARLELPPAPPLPRAIRERWPTSLDVDLAKLPIDHRVLPSEIAGGHRAAQARLREFLDCKLTRYADDRNDPDADGSSGFSPYLHFGHLSVHQIFHALAEREGWRPEKLGKVTGSREGWWGLSAASEAFLDELVTWRELGFNFSALREDAAEFGSLPHWARQTLHDHEKDPRPRLYDLATLEAAATYDPVWNAAQRQLVREGRIHNYLRMVWGKRLLEWTRTPEEAAQMLVQLNDRWALDGRDPNSYSGIFWVFGRYDRPWGPERPIYGKVRYMSSENTVRKLAMKQYLAKFGSGAQLELGVGR